MNEEKSRVTTVRLQNISYGHKQSATLKAAIELDLFTKISEGAGTFGEVASALGITELNAERLVVACAAIGLLEKVGVRYRNAPDVERFLVRGKPSYVGPWLVFSAHDFEHWKDLKDFLTTEEPGLGAGFLFAKNVDLTRRKCILDLGGGSGAYCIAALQRYPHLRAIVMDFEPVTRMTRKFVAQWGLQEQISTLAGDFTRDPFPEGADVIIQASNLPQYNEETLGQVLRKGFEALEPGGEYHVVGETISDEKDGTLGPALWGIHEALFGSLGRAHSESEVRSYLEKAGFVDITVNEFIPGSLTRITGIKPA
ncbi:MAG: methyltransferase domain-containing protein [Deltaproteobacteria bacterium]|nr:methyltransferase domain-containing protein [Deltaproteobacteria bacterium]